MVVVQKRDKRVVPFDKDKIRSAVEKALFEVRGKEAQVAIAQEVANKVASAIENKEIVDIEEIQDLVEFALMQLDPLTAKAYILYRELRSQSRVTHPYNFLTPELISKYKHLPDPFPTEMGKIVYYRTYSRPVEAENRRERWWETVARVVEFSSWLEKEAISKVRSYTKQDEERLKEEAANIFDLMFNLKLFPAGRSLWTANTKASYQHPLSNFNCSFCTLDSFKKFSEIFSLLMLGTGAGLSVERQYVNKLPKVNTRIEVIHKHLQRVPKKERKEFTEIKQLSKNIMEITIGDSKAGWATALQYYFDIISLKQFFEIEFILLNYDNIRPAGERLKTFGGYASGEGAIKQMFDKINRLLQGRKEQENVLWYKMKPIDILDVATIIAENVISGGVRRSSLIVFCDPDEKEVIEAKNTLYKQNSDGQWQANDAIIHRMLSNNTIIYNDRPTKEQLKKQFELIRYSGEPSFGNMQEMRRRRADVQGGNP